MATNRLVQVVTNQRGTIVAVLRLPAQGSAPQAGGSDKGQVQVRVTPMPGQFVADVLLPDEVGALETAEDFQKLVEEFELPRHATTLTRRKVDKPATGRKGRERPRSKRTVRSR